LEAACHISEEDSFQFFKCDNGWTSKLVLGWLERGYQYLALGLWLRLYKKHPVRGVACLSSVRIVSTVQWYCRPWGTEESRPIRGPKEIEAWRAFATDDGLNLPANWTRLENKSNEDNRKKFVYRRSWETSTPARYHYKHESDPTTEFWYPIRLCEGLQALPSRHLETLINCRTQRTWLCLANRASTYSPLYRLRDAEGAWIGILQLHNWPESDYSSSSHRLACELVEISRGYAYEGKATLGMDEWYHSDRPKLPEGEKYEFVNVLWVEWDEGIAYRKAIGRVMKSAWDAQELEWIDLVLG